MTDSGAVFAIARADVRQRSRRRAVLVVPALIGYLGYLIAGGRWNLVIGRFGSDPELYGGTPDLAWYAGALCLAGTTVLVLFGYQLLSGRIEEDRRSGPGVLVATSPVRDGDYILGKWLSHLYVSGVVILGLMLAAVAMFMARGLGAGNLWGLVSPFLLATLPAMALVAAVTVFFETLSRGREAMVGFAYFVLAGATLSMALPGGLPSLADPFGIGMIRDSMMAAAVDQIPGLTESVTFGFSNLRAEAGRFLWDGIALTEARVVERLGVVAISAAIVLLAATSFRRLAPRGERADWDDGGDGETLSSWLPRIGARWSVPSLPESRDGGGGWTRIMLSEFRISVRGRGRWWYAAALVAFLAGATASVETATETVLPFAWLLGLPVWTELGVRERRDWTAPLVFTAYRASSQVWAAWLAAVVVALLLAAGVFVRLLLAGDTAAMLSLAAGAAVLPSLALALGSLSGSRRPFEAAYLMVWYLGPVNGLEALDYTVGAETGYLEMHLAAAAVLLGTGVLGQTLFRRRL